MADVRPFRGVTYDPARVALGNVLCDPYDVIGPTQLEAYLGREPHNFVRVVLNPAGGDARYKAAAAALQAWIADGVLRQAPAPAFYVHRQSFRSPVDGAPVSRTGVIGAVRVEPWASGAVKPHEHTMPGPKQDRLRLLRATGADTEPIWVFHPDDSGAVRTILDAVVGRAPDLSTPYSSEPLPGGRRGEELHELWEVTDPGTVRELAAALSAVQLYIADGHHRYETALFHAEEAGGSSQAATRFKVMLISPYDDPGLLVLPTHRLVKMAPGHSLGAMLSTLRGWGWSSQQPGNLGDLQARLAAPPAPGCTGFGLYAEGRFSYLEGRVALDPSSLDPAIADLDVALVHEGILQPLCGIDMDMAGSANLAFTREAHELVQRVDSGEFEAGVLLRAPTLRQVRAVADAGANMPQKSTYFWPKPASGLVLALQPPGAEI